MTITVDIPKELLTEAEALTRIDSKPELIKRALEELIRKRKISGLKAYFGRIDLDIDMDTLRS